MVIHFKPILSKLLFLGLFLLAVQIKNSAVEADDRPPIQAKEPCDYKQEICQNLGLSCFCVPGTPNDVLPFCGCNKALDTSSQGYTHYGCIPATKNSGESANMENSMFERKISMAEMEICRQKCANGANNNTPPTLTTTVCERDDNGITTCVCSPAPAAASEQNVDELVETAKAVISGLVNAIVTFVQDLVQALVDLVTALANLPLADILTGLVGSLKGIVGNIAGGEDSE